MSNEDAFLALLESHGAAIRRIAWAYAGETGEHEDLYQEILAQAWRSLPSFRGDSGAGTWLYRVALNTALTWRRRNGKHSASDPSRNGAERGSPESSRSEAAILKEFLSSLTGPDHTILLLYMEGLSHQEIAAVTGLGASAVGVRIHRMKKAFTDRYVER